MHPKAIITFPLLVLFFSNVAPAPGPAPAPGAGSGSVCVKPNDPNPDPSDCSKFFLCAAGKPHPMSCRDGTLYNPSVMSCDHAFNVDCHAPDPAPSPDHPAPQTSADIKKKATVEKASKKKAGLCEVDEDCFKHTFCHKLNNGSGICFILKQGELKSHLEVKVETEVVEWW